ncbi:hypothetical protein [Bordetella phage vB_BbrS_PHB09]|nr:hypothetical protein [Bordetella phage vB_BbrS_PHB09]
MTLALRLGRTVGELMSGMDTYELSLWREFDRMSPIGDERADERAALLATVTARSAGVKVDVGDMRLRWGEAESQDGGEAGADAMQAFLLRRATAPPA